MKTAPDPKQPSDPEWLVQLRLDVDELIEEREIRSQWVGPDKRSTRKADDPDLAKRRAGGFAWPPPDDDRHRIHAPLLEQLRRLRDGLAPGGNEGGGRRAPGSRLPAGSDSADLVVDITTGAADLWWQLLHARGRQEEAARYARVPLVTLTYNNPALPRTVTCRIPADLDYATARFGMPDRLALTEIRGSFIGYDTPPPEQCLRALPDLLIDLDDMQLRRKICTRVHRWVLAARLALSYAAPMMPIGYECPHCQQHTLITRSDASGDVFCTTAGCLDDNGQPPRWTRQTWPLLLLAAANATTDDTTETA